MLCIEVFRPDEMALVLNQKNNKKLLRNLGKKQTFDVASNNSDLAEQQPDNPYVKMEDGDSDHQPFEEYKVEKPAGDISDKKKGKKLIQTQGVKAMLKNKGARIQ